MQNGKFDMFADYESEEMQELDEMNIEESVEVDNESDTKKRFSAVGTRSKEEYEEMIDHIYYETYIHPETGLEYEVRVTVFKPEENPFENLKPAFAFSTQH